MLGLALEGGGARGAFHMGAYRALAEEGYRFDGVVGTSVGAINGAVIAQGDWEQGYDWWSRLGTADLFDIEEEFLNNLGAKLLDRQALSEWLREAGLLLRQGIDTQKLRRTLAGILREDKLRRAPVDFGIVTVLFRDSSPDKPRYKSPIRPLELFKEDIPQGLLLEYIMASANLPGFKLEPIDGKYYLDGGFWDNCPVNMLDKKGYDRIVAIRTHSFGRKRKVKNKALTLTTIEPSEGLGGVMNFGTEHAENRLKMGYCDAMRVLRGLKGRRYYLSPPEDEERFFRLFAGLQREDIRKLAAIPSDGDPRRILFEKILPDLFAALELPADAGYEELAIALCERAAEARGIDRYAPQSFDGLLDEVGRTPLKKEGARSTPAGRAAEHFIHLINKERA